MSHYVKISGKGQVTLPAELRKKLNIGPGSYIKITEEEGAYKIIPQEQGISNLKGAVQVKEKQDFKNSRHKAMEELANEKNPGN